MRRTDNFIGTAVGLLSQRQKILIRRCCGKNVYLEMSALNFISNIITYANNINDFNPCGRQNSTKNAKMEIFWDAILVPNMI